MYDISAFRSFCVYLRFHLFLPTFVFLYFSCFVSQSRKTKYEEILSICHKFLLHLNNLNEIMNNIATNCMAVLE